jgi:hypothetical protein
LIIEIPGGSWGWAGRQTSALELGHIIGSDKDPDRWSELKVNSAKLQASRSSWLDATHQNLTVRAVTRLHIENDGAFLVNLFHVLRLTVAVRPVLFWHFNQIYKDILSPQLYTLVQTVCESPVEALFQLNRAATVQCDLQENAFV